MDLIEQYKQLSEKRSALQNKISSLEANITLLTKQRDALLEDLLTSTNTSSLEDARTFLKTESENLKSIIDSASNVLSQFDTEMELSL